MKKFPYIFLLLIIIMIGMASVAHAAGSYEPVTVEIPIGGTGEFQLKEAGTEDAAAVVKKALDGSGSLEVTLSDPGRYVYELFSEDEINTKRYNVIIDVLTNETAELSALVTLAARDGDRKVPVAYYPVAVIDPPISKKVEGAGAPDNEVFTFEFRAVSTSVESLQGVMPMPAGVEGQSMKLQVTGSGSVESGTIYLLEPGTYEYEFREIEGTVAGFRYDSSVYRVHVEVTEGDKCLETKTTVYKDGIETAAEQLEFINIYAVSESPQTGDPSRIILWSVIGGAAVLLLAAVIIYGIKSRKEYEAK